MSSPPRPSKFIEGSASTRPDLLSRTQTSNSHLYSILHEMDVFESRRQSKLSSNSSSESLPSPTSPAQMANLPPTSSPREGFVVNQGRRSINFTRSSVDKELGDGSKRRESGSSSTEDEEGASDTLARKFVGRLRALTGGRERDREREREHKGYPGS